MADKNGSRNNGSNQGQGCTQAQLRRFIKQTRDRLHTLLIWRHDSDDGREPTWLQQFFHFWVLAGQSFVKNRCLIHASALAYTTVLALIPMLAIVMGISSSLLREDSEERMQEFVNRIVDAVVPPAELEMSMQANGTGITEKDVREGRYCGACHDGNTAFGVMECTRCHIEPPEPVIAAPPAEEEAEEPKENA